MSTSSPSLERPSTSGPQAVCATSTVVTVTSSSLRTSTAGSGLPTRSDSTQQTDGHSMTGLKQEVLVDLSPTAVNPDLTRLAWLC